MAFINGMVLAPSPLFPQPGFRALPNRFDGGTRRQVTKRLGRLGRLGDACTAAGGVTGPGGTCSVDLQQQSAAYLNQQNAEVAAAVAAAPTSNLALFEQQYGQLPQSVQNQILSCQTYVSDAGIFGTPIPSSCPMVGGNLDINSLIAALTPSASTAPGNAPNLTASGSPIVYKATPGGGVQITAASGSGTQGGGPVLGTTSQGASTGTSLPSSGQPNVGNSSFTSSDGSSGTSALVAPAGTGTGTAGSSSSSTSDISTWIENNWVLLAAAATGIVLLMSVGGKK